MDKKKILLTILIVATVGFICCVGIVVYYYGSLNKQQNEYEKLAEIVRLNSDEQDFNDKVANNYRLKDHVRRWEHTKDKKKTILTPDPNAELREPPKSVEDEAIGNVLVEQFMETLNETDSKIFSRKLAGYTQSEIAKELGFSSNSAVSKRLADMEQRFREMIK